jgi:hypothetical protein
MYKEVLELAVVGRKILKDDRLKAVSHLLMSKRESITDDEFVDGIFLLLADTVRLTMVETLNVVLTEEQANLMDETAGELLDIGFTEK